MYVSTKWPKEFLPNRNQPLLGVCGKAMLGPMKCRATYQSARAGTLRASVSFGYVGRKDFGSWKHFGRKYHII